MSYKDYQMPSLSWMVGPNNFTGDKAAHAAARKQVGLYLIDNELVSKPLNMFTDQEIDNMICIAWTTFVEHCMYSLVKDRKDHYKWCDDDQPPF